MHDNIRRLLTIDVKVYRDSVHSGGRYSERKGSRWVKEIVAEQLLELLKAKKAAKVRPLVLRRIDVGSFLCSASQGAQSAA